MFYNSDIDGVFVLPKKVLQYINDAKKSELKFIMYIFSNPQEFDIDKATEALGETKESINASLAFWRGTGIISEKDGGNFVVAQESEKTKGESAPKADSKERSYTTLEIADARQNDIEFRHLAEYTESVTGVLLNSAKLSDLFYLYDGLGMQSDVIMGIVAYCASVDKKKIRYIVKTAEGIHNDGVVTYKELESYLKAKKEYAEFESFVKRTIGAGDRALTSSEIKLVKKWESELKISRELVTLAYEKTISVISKPSIPYMSKILEGWSNEGITKASQVEKLAENKAQEKKISDEKAKGAGFDFDLSDIFERP